MHTNAIKDVPIDFGFQSLHYPNLWLIIIFSVRRKTMQPIKSHRNREYFCNVNSIICNCKPSRLEHFNQTGCDAVDGREKTSNVFIVKSSIDVRRPYTNNATEVGLMKSIWMLKRIGHANIESVLHDFAQCAFHKIDGESMLILFVFIQSLPSAMSTGFSSM